MSARLGDVAEVWDTCHGQRQSVAFATWIRVHTAAVPPRPPVSILCPGSSLTARLRSGHCGNPRLRPHPLLPAAWPGW